MNPSDGSYATIHPWPLDKSQLASIQVRNLVVTIEDEFPLLRVVAIGGDGAIQDILLTVNFEVIVFVPSFEEATEHENDDAVADDENAFIAVVARQGSKETLHSERDIRATPTSRWASVDISTTDH